MVRCPRHCTVIDPLHSTFYFIPSQSCVYLKRNAVRKVRAGSGRFRIAALCGCQKWPYRDHGRFGNFTLLRVTGKGRLIMARRLILERCYWGASTERSGRLLPPNQLITNQKKQNFVLAIIIFSPWTHSFKNGNFNKFIFVNSNVGKDYQVILIILFLFVTTCLINNKITVSFSGKNKLWQVAWRAWRLVTRSEII